MEGKKNNEAKGVMRIYPNAPLDFCRIPHGTRLCFIRTEHDGSFVFEYEMPEVDDEKMVDAIRMSLMITMSDAVLYPGCDITIDQAFAWLEEKKAKTTVLPELAESEDERVRKYLIEELKAAKSVGELKFVIPQPTKEECIAYLEKQKEQKPAEWSDTDNIGWDEAFACVTRAEKAAKNEEELQNAVTAEKWLKEIKFKYYVHPVKPEWSEEDEKNLELVTDCIYEFYPDSVMKYKLKDWLKSLRPQYHGDVTMTEAYKMGFEAGKASSWKPSEEQMGTLKEALETYKGFGGYDAMKSLYNDLKKRM